MHLYVINVAAAMSVLAGYHLAFRQKRVRAWSERLRNPSRRADPLDQAQAASMGGQEIASVLRMAGVMVMAFSFTAAAFADLIAYYASFRPI